jgi:hypothetical protein
MGLTAGTELNGSSTLWNSLDIKNAAHDSPPAQQIARVTYEAPISFAYGQKY